MVVAGGAQSSLHRIDWIRDSRATVLLSTPTYALRLAEVAQENGVDLSSASIRMTIHAGEPGASIPTTRRRIEEAWGARAFDHAGSTEAGAWGYECPAGSGMHLLESDFIGEVLEVGGDRAVRLGENGGLVLTNLGRWDMPVVRYRTGDIVRVGAEACECGSPYVCFPGAVLGRADDMIQLRGMRRTALAGDRTHTRRETPMRSVYVTPSPCLPNRSDDTLLKRSTLTNRLILKDFFSGPEPVPPPQMELWNGSCT
jgi:phenylacetate-CoA ligase